MGRIGSNGKDTAPASRLENVVARERTAILAGLTCAIGVLAMIGVFAANAFGERVSALHLFIGSSSATVDGCGLKDE